MKRAKSNSALRLFFADDLASRALVIQRMAPLYEALSKRKNFGKAVDLNVMCDLMRDDPRFVIGAAFLDDDIIAARVGYSGVEAMVDFLAASGEKAKNTYANYLLLWGLIERAKAIGLAGFDCGGIDPADNLGVYNFKKGLGGTLSLTGPAWIYHRSGLVRKVLPALLAL